MVWTLPTAKNSGPYRSGEVKDIGLALALGPLLWSVLSVVTSVKPNKISSCVLILDFNTRIKFNSPLLSAPSSCEMPTARRLDSIDTARPEGSCLQICISISPFQMQMPTYIWQLTRALVRSFQSFVDTNGQHDLQLRQN